MPCGLFEIVTTGLALSVPFGEAGLPAGSLVERTGDCSDGAAVVVRQVPALYGWPDLVGSEGCVPVEALGPPPTHALVRRGSDEGDVVRLEPTDTCGRWLLDGDPSRSLEHVEAISDAERLAV